MDIYFEDGDLSDPKKRKGKFQHVYPQLERRLRTLSVARTLDEFVKSFPAARCHEYKGEQQGIFTINLTGNWRLRFRPHDTEISVKDWKDVTAIDILGVDDPH